MNFLSRRPLGPNTPGTGEAPAKSSLFKDLREGFSYTIRTPWLLWTLIWACLSVLFLIGPIEVLLPFVVQDQLGGDSRMFGFLLAIMGVGSAIAALATASLRLPPPLPDRDGDDMGGLGGSLPVAAIGFMDSFWMLGVAMLIFGVTEGIGTVIWGTLLQRRVPRHLLGRISSLDFFVSLALMPVSMLSPARWPRLSPPSGSFSSLVVWRAPSWPLWRCSPHG